jgi:cellulose synthase (UDP-forming)
LIYLFVQLWNCHPEKESGLHLRGMFLKFACWPVFFLGFLLSLWNGEIPYIPTAKQAMKGFTAFARPLLIHQGLFLATLSLVVIERGFYTAEARLTLTSGEIWGMVAFCFIAFLTSLGGLYAAYESKNLDAAEPWAIIDLDNISIKPEENKVSEQAFALDI